MAELTQEDLKNIRDLAKGSTNPVAKLDALFNFFEEVLPNIEEYRAKNIGKYYAEENLPYGGEYQKLEKYKNRVRVVDTFLKPLIRMLRSSGVIQHDDALDQIP